MTVQLRPGRRSSRNNRNEIGGSIGGPIVQDKLFFFGSLSPRFVDRTERLPVRRTATRARSTSKQTSTQAFGKVTYDRPAGCGPTSRRSGRPTTSTARCRPTTAPAPNAHLQLEGGERRARTTRGFDRSAEATSPAPWTITLTNTSLLSVRGGYFHDNYKDTGISDQPDLQYQHRPSSGSPACRRQSAAAAPGSRTRRASQIDELRHHQARLRPTSTTTRRSTPAARTTSRAASAVQHTVERRRTRPTRGGYVNVCWDQALRQPTRRASADRGHLRLLRGQRPRHARQGRRQHPLALRAGHVEGRQSPDPEPRPAHRARERSRRSARHPDERVRVRLRRQARAAPRRAYDVAATAR